MTLDGTNRGTVDLYSATTTWQQKVWGTGPLTSGPHTVTISCTGLKRAAAAGTDIDADAFDINGVLAGRYEQNNAKLIYSGTWKTASSASASAGSFSHTNSSGASVTIHFSGIELA